MTYPATNSNEATKLIIDGGNQLHEIINEDALTTIITESGEIPSVRKAITDTFLFQEPIAWSQGSDETVFNQLRTFNNETYWAPTATLSSPVPMGVTPVGDSNWKLAPVGSNSSMVQGWDTQSQNEVVSGSIFPDVGVLVDGDDVPVGTTHLRILVNSSPTIVSIHPIASGIVSLLTEVGATIGATETDFTISSTREFKFLYNSSAVLSVDGLVKLGDKVVVENYHEGIDSGRLFFRVVASGTGTADGGKYIDLPISGLQLEQNLRKPYNIKAWGAKGNDIADDSLAFTNANIYATGGGEVFVPVGKYNIGATYVREGVTLVGESKKFSILKPNTAPTVFSIGLTQPYSGLKNISIDGVNSEGYGVLVDAPKTVVIEDVAVFGFKGATTSLDGIGMVFQSTYSHSIRDTEITNNRVDVLLRDIDEVNELIFDNCTIEYSDEEGVIIDNGIGIVFQSCSFGHHGPTNTNKAIKVTNPSATIRVIDTWFEFCADAIDFAGQHCVVDNCHSAAGMNFTNGISEVTNSDFYGLGGKVKHLSGNAIVKVDSNINQDGHPLYDNTGGGIRYKPNLEVTYLNGTLTPQTSGTVSVLASEDAIREVSDGFNASVNGRLSVSAINAPVGNYIAITGLKYPCANLTENADHATGSCTYYDASTASFKVIPILISGGLSELRIFIDASTIEVSDTFTVSITYPIA